MKFFTTVRISENISETPEGFLVCLGVPIARTGEQIYTRGELPDIEADANGQIIVVRDASEVFRKETITSFEGKSLTLWHPSEFVKPENWSALTKGVLQNVRRGTGAHESDLLADILVTDKRAIELVKGGLREVSCGYEADYVQMGVGRAAQKNIIGNHLAMVDEGRAGAAYAIMDHKGKGKPMLEKFKALFGKTPEEMIEEKEKASIQTLDAVAKAIVALGEKVDAIGQKTTDLLTAPAPAAPAQPSAEAGAAPAPTMEERMAKLEAAIAALLEGQATKDKDGEEKPKEDKEEVKDEDGDDEVTDEACEDEDGDDEETEDAEKDDDDKETKDADEEKEMTADEKSRVEILAPGMRAEGKDAKAKALKTCYATKDGKTVIDRFTNGKSPDFKDPQFINAVFVGASEILKETRSDSFATTKTRDVKSFSSFASEGAMTAEAINKKNADYYAGKH